VAAPPPPGKRGFSGNGLGCSQAPAAPGASTPSNAGSAGPAMKQMAGFVESSGSTAFHPAEIHRALWRPLQAPGDGKATSKRHRLRCRRPGWGPRAPLHNPHTQVVQPPHGATKSTLARAGKARVTPGADARRFEIKRIQRRPTGMNEMGLPIPTAATARFPPPASSSPWGKPAGPTLPAWWGGGGGGARMPWLQERARPI